MNTINVHSNISNHEAQDRRTIENRNRKYVDFSFGLSNARSLWSKIDALGDFFAELRLAFAVITETWFTKGDKLGELEQTARGEHGLSFINRVRPRTAGNNPGGGVSIVYDSSKIKLKEYTFRKNGHEPVSYTHLTLPTTPYV